MKSRFPIFERYLQFAYEDIEKMNSDKRILAAYNILLLSTGLSSSTPEEDTAHLPEFMHKNLDSILKDLERTQEEVKNTIELMFLNVLIRKDLKKNPGKFKGGVPPHDHPDRPTDLCESKASVTITCGTEWERDNKSFGERQIVSKTTINGTFRERLKHHLYLSLDGIFVKDLRQCKECNRVFIHTSKRVRDFCENKCASRFRVRQNRAEKREISMTEKEDK